MKVLMIGGAALLFLAGAAEAGSSRGGHGGHGGHSGGSSAGQPRAEAEANATARQRQRQTQRQSQVARGGNARATGGRANATVIVNNTGGGSGGGTGVLGTPTGTAATTGAGASGGGAGGDGGGAYHSTVSGTTTLRTAPDVAAPAIWSNNPCIISASGSVSVVGFGASIGAGIEDPDCTRRANAQLLAALGQTDAAREVLCANREVREAFMRAGRPCAADVANFRPVRATVAPAAAVAPQQVAAPAPVAVAAPAPVVVAAPAAWCQAQPGESAADRLMRQHNCR